MRTIQLLFTFTVLLGVTLCDNQSSFFDKIALNEFGQTMIETIQLEMNSSDFVDHILEMLQQMRADTEAEQSSESTKIKDRESTCAERVAEIDTTVQRASEKKADDQQQLPLKLEELQDKSRQALDKGDEESRNNDRISVLTQERKSSRSTYEVRRDELTGMAVALKEGKQIIGQLKTPSFIQLSDGIFNQIKEHHQQFVKYYPNKRGFNSLVSLLLEIASDASVQADQEQVDTILSVLDDLIESLYEVQKAEMYAEDAKGLAFQTEKARLDLSNANLVQSVASLEAQVQTLSQSLLELNNDIAAQQSIVDAKATERQDWNKTCTDEQNGYDKQTALRQEQLDIVGKCIEIFENGLSGEARSKLQGMRV